MRLNHVALWADDIESVRLFYMKYFGALCNDRYVNESKKFTSYFLSFDEGTACLELMNRPRYFRYAFQPRPSERFGPFVYIGR